MSRSAAPTPKASWNFFKGFGFITVFYILSQWMVKAPVRTETTTTPILFSARSGIAIETVLERVVTSENTVSPPSIFNNDISGG